MRPRWTRWLVAGAEQLLLSALVLVLFQASNVLFKVSVFVPVSPLAGLGLALLLLRGPRASIALALGMFAAQWQLGRPAGPALLMTAMYPVQALAAWFVVVRLFRTGQRFGRPRDVVALAVAGVVAGAIRTAVQVPVLLQEGTLTRDLFGFANLSLWVSALSGVLVFTPAMVAVARGGLFREGASRRRDVSFALVLGIAAQAVLFLAPRQPALGMLAFSLCVLPLLTLVALRGTATATAVMTSILAAILMYATARHLGPFGAARFPDDVRLVQTTLVPVGFFMLLLSSAEMSRRRALRALSAGKAQMERALEGSNSGLWEWRADTNRNAYDARIARMFGESPDTGLKLRPGRYTGVHPDDEARLRKAMEDHFAGLTPGFEVEIRHRHRDGGYVWVLDRGRVMERDAQGAPLVLAGTLTDITERKRAEAERAALEERVQQAQKFEGLSLLAGGVAHDFNNILTSILGHADLARRGAPAGSSASQHLDHIIAGARAAADLTRQMLAYAGRGHIAMQPVSLVRLVTEMGHLLQVAIPRGVTLRYDFAADLPAVEADPAQLRQVVMNLILNAAEALGDRGTVTVRLGAMWCDRTMLTSRWLDDELPEGHYVTLQVDDDGPGMAPETLARIFDPFFTTKFTGRGLGLAAVLGIVRGHRGSVLVDTAPAQGTKFRVLLPVSSSPARPEAYGASPAEWCGAGLALVVDDEEAVRVLAQAMMRRLGFEVVTAADGHEALARFRERPAAFRVVLLDLTMPGKNGLAVAREMHAAHESVRVVLTTGYSAPPWSGGERPAGMAGFLEKPYRLEDLARVLREALEPQPETIASR